MYIWLVYCNNFPIDLNCVVRMEEEQLLMEKGKYTSGEQIDVFIHLHKYIYIDIFIYSY